MHTLTQSHIQLYLVMYPREQGSYHPSERCSGVEEELAKARKELRYADQIPIPPIRSHPELCGIYIFNVLPTLCILLALLIIIGCTTIFQI